MRNSIEGLDVVVEQALANMRTQPKRLDEAISYVAGLNDIEIPQPLEILAQHLEASLPTDRVRHLLTLKLQQWDHVDQPTWSPETEPHSEARREVLLVKLGFSSAQASLVNLAIPRFSVAEVAIVIAEKHEPWYAARRPLLKNFYWEHYTTQLLAQGGTWDSDAIAALDASTDDVISRIADPTLPSIYQVKGLVMGYVQSGKTSHFSGLIAKAADAGYRFIVVLAGTMDILRQQTQRRIDKQLVGQELLDPEEYGSDADWNAFVRHGGRPSDLGVADWERLTNRSNDYAALRQHLSVLEFRSSTAGLRFNDAENLKSAPIKLAIIKKTPSRINKLYADLHRLKALRNRLEQVPTLVIDDESDQASINTIDPAKATPQKKRTGTNKSIGDLLRLLPRAQYIGYTATPFANVFIDPEDAEDMFPKDFFVSLPRPRGYMGVADFYDLARQYDESDYRSNKAAHVRPVVGPNEDAANLPRAIDSFVVAGAIKLFRHAAKPDAERFKHHTMLVHHSSKKVVHAAEANEIKALFRGGARYMNASGMGLLKQLFDADFRPVSAVRAPDEPFPKNFDQLKPYISECISRIQAGKSVLIVNGDNKDDTPDFEQAPVWAILVGGAKLSRGYTVEGLTTSYYRRPAGAGDTLMQMGRWFGFRAGYADLVRVFLGTKERKGKIDIDLYEAFGAVCRDEEALRKELQIYRFGGLTPAQIPPLVHQHLQQLPPTAKNKMFNARIESMDMAGDWTEKTAAPIKDSAVQNNLLVAGELLGAVVDLERGKVSVGDVAGQAWKYEAVLGCCSTDAVVEFLTRYQWADSKAPVGLELRYIEANRARLKDWIILLPLVSSTDHVDFPGTALKKISVVERSRVSETRFGVYSEPRHRAAAQFLAGDVDKVSSSEILLRFRGEDRGVLLLYFVRDGANPTLGVSVGFGIQFPGQKSSSAITWTVRSAAQPDDVVVAI